MLAFLGNGQELGGGISIVRGFKIRENTIYVQLEFRTIHTANFIKTSWIKPMISEHFLPHKGG